MKFKKGDIISNIVYPSIKLIVKEVKGKYYTLINFYESIECYPECLCSDIEYLYELGNNAAKLEKLRKIGL